MLAGLVMGSTGCEVISSVDRDQIGNNGGAGGIGGSGGSGGSTCVPENDQNECTDDVCNTDGTTAHNPKTAGEPCTTGGSQCDGNGKCVACIVATDCPGTDDACQTRTCTANVCGTDFTAADTPIPTQTPGDCKIAVCDGSGKTIQNNDDADVKDDSNACTTDTCDAGTPSNTNLPQGTDCTPPGGPDPLVCNDMGQCIGCNEASDCPGTDDECSQRTCTVGVCGVSFTTKDMPVAAQTSNDCLVHVCDGAGNFVDIADDADVPLFSDLLLHDVAAAEKDGIADGIASMREFRTSPLWGIARTAPYMHDGAAWTPEDAISLHFAEGQKSADAYQALDAGDREALVAFLRSL